MVNMIFILHLLSTLSESLPDPNPARPDGPSSGIPSRRQVPRRRSRPLSLSTPLPFASSTFFPDTCELLSRVDENVYQADCQALQGRKSSNPIHPMLLARTSSRILTGEPVTRPELMSLFEAARWAPSYYNTQPWRFIYAYSGTKEWPKFFNLLVDKNKAWCQNASVLMVIANVKYQNYKNKVNELEKSEFDTGAAWMAMAIEGSTRGLVVHAMAAFDHEKAARDLGIPQETHKINAMIAIGRRPSLQTRVAKAINEKVTQRNEITSFISEGKFQPQESDIFKNIPAKN